MVKSNRNGQSATLSSEQLDAIASELGDAPRAVFTVCRFTAARINEALNLKWENMTPTEIVIPKNVTKKSLNKADPYQSSFVGRNVDLEGQMERAAN